MIEIRNKDDVTIPDYMSLVNKTSTLKRYTTSFIQERVEKLNEYKEEILKHSQNIIKYIYKDFDQYYQIWKKLISRIAELDCLISLQKVSSKFDIRCKPIFTEPSIDAPVLEIYNSKHPLYIQLNHDWVENTVCIGGRHKSTIILTGANMGGKSSILRQTWFVFLLLLIIK